MIKKLTLLTLILLLSSCSYYDFKRTTGGFPVDNTVRSVRTGKACTINVLGLIAVGDSSIEAAKNNGNIKKVSVVDTSYTQLTFYLPWFQNGCTLVSGEEK